MTPRILARLADLGLLAGWLTVATVCSLPGALSRLLGRLGREREEPIEAECVGARLRVATPCPPSWSSCERNAWGGFRVEVPQMACTTGHPVELDAEDRALIPIVHFVSPTTGPIPICGDASRASYDRGDGWTIDRDRFLREPHRCPECARRLQPEGEA